VTGAARPSAPQAEASQHLFRSIFIDVASTPPWPGVVPNVVELPLGAYGRAIALGNKAGEYTSTPT